MQIIPLSEGKFTVDRTKQFVPFDESKDELQQRPVGSLLVDIQPFVVVCEKDILLLDTGLGFEKNGKPQIHENLLASNIDPADVTKVLISHLHKDHAGGIASGMETSQQLNFPNAIYYVQERELNFALEKGNTSYQSAEFRVLQDSSQLKLLKEDKGTIDDYISYEVTSAHSKYHQVFWIREEAELIFFGGDDAPQLQQMKHRFVAKYDHDGKKAMEYRRVWWAQGTNEHWTFLFYHDLVNPVFKL